LSAFIDGTAAVGDILRRESRAVLPVIVLGEFLYGIAQSRDRAAYEDWLAMNLPRFELLPVEEQTATHYARLRVGLRQSGQPIPSNDAWIAALALQHDLPVLTRDRHFESVAGLRLRIW
jgi:tRNA(fMet)-specific endonuclease VapC